MRYERLLLRLAKVLLGLGLSLGAIGALIIGASAYRAGEAGAPDRVSPESSACKQIADCGPVRFNVEDTSPPDGANDVGTLASKVTSIEGKLVPGSQAAGGQKVIDSPNPTQADGASTSTNPPLELADRINTSADEPTTNPALNVERGAATISGTLPISGHGVSSDLYGQVATSSVTTTLPSGVSADLVSEEPYTSTAQVHARPEAQEDPGSELPGTQSLPTDEAGLIQCPTTSSASFDLVAVAGPRTDRPDFAHGDFNLTLRGYAVIPERRALVLYNGATDLDAPQLSGLFQPNHAPIFKSTYQVNHWIWDPNQCGGVVQGCVGPQIDDWDVTMVGIATTPGEAISIPERGVRIFGGDFRALVLYADERQITLGYTRRDTVAHGYAVHILDICVDPNLLTLYRAQNDANGRRSTGLLPALRIDQRLGVASGDQIKVAIRDKGSFMDPRSRKDWWRGY